MNANITIEKTIRPMPPNANYGNTWPDKVNNSINFIFPSPHSDFAGNLGKNNLIKV